MSTSNGRIERRPGSLALWGMLFALVLGALLRGLAAWNQSLIVDEFHSHYHATQPSLRILFETLRLDNHPPLSFLLFRWAFAICGDSPFGMRLLSIASGLAAIALTAVVARRLPAGFGQALAPVLLAVSSLHLDVSSDVRMYGLHALCVLGLIHALLRALDDHGPRWPVAVWLWAGLHIHYYFLHYAFVLAVAVLGLAAFAPRYRPAPRRLLPATLLAGLACLPWYALGFWPQLQHGELPGGRSISLTRWLESLLHQLYLNMSLGGAQLRPLYLIGGALALLLAAFGAFRLVRRSLGEGDYALPALLLAATFAAPAWAGLVAWLHERAGFNWNYLAASVAPLCLLISAAWNERRLRLTSVHRMGLQTAGAAGAIFVTATAAQLAWSNAHWVGPEDYRGAVQRILDEAGPEDAVVSAEIQPRFFPLGLAWRYYAPRLAAASGQTVPTRLALTAPRPLAEIQKLTNQPRVFHMRLLEPELLERHPQLFLLGRTLPHYTPVLGEARAHYAAEVRYDHFGWGIEVWRWW